MIRNIDWLRDPCAKPDDQARQSAESRQAQLTKPAGSLGQLERIAMNLAALQGTATPRVDHVHIVVYAADHGVAQEGVSAFPQAVTTEMVRNFARGGAAISVIARELGATLHVVNLGTINDPGALDNVSHRSLGKGTANFTREPAMTPDQLADALAIGRDAVLRAHRSGAQLFIGGEMGIANTTSATALACALLGLAPTAVAGPGTGLNASGVAHKAAVVARGLDLHAQYLSQPLEALRRLGGFEIAALVGSYIACAQLGIAVLVDGFIATSAALTATKLHSGAKPWLLYAHTSAEPGHALLLAALDAKPLLNIGMRLGEGSGAAAAVPLLRLACATHNHMATFADAGVSGKIS